MSVLRLPAILLVVLPLAACMQVRSTFIPVADMTPNPPPGYGPAYWALDSAFADPGPESTELHVLVWERACNGGTQVFGRTSLPEVTYEPTTVMITIGVRPLDGAQTCPLGPGTPILVQLEEPLGERTLLDGGREPPSEPSPP